MNWIAIIVAAVSALVVGFVWYNPKVFGTAWMKGLGLSEEDLQQGSMAVTFGLAFVLSGVIAYFLSTYAGYHEGDDRSFVHGMFHTSMACATFALPVLITNSLFEKQGWGNILINAGYWLVVFAIMGGIVFAWV